MVRKACIPLLLLILVSGFQDSAVRAQDFDAFARVKISPRDVVVREPFRVTISVHTATWFTAPLDFANLRIENAFIIPFTRTLSSVEYIQRKKYATLTFYYLVIPYETGPMEVPALEITATTPPVGDYKGQALALRTRAHRIDVKEIPGSEDGLWMVARNLSYRESWDKDLEELKAGDVVERRIVLDVSGTLPSLIQALEIEKPAGVSLYPAPPGLKDTRTARDVNGRRTERYSYLFEEAGRVEIPETLIRWWDPGKHRIFQRSIPARTLEIAENPDMEMMLSLKDSLDSLQLSTLPVEERAPFPWKKYGLIAFGMVLAGILLFKVLYRIRRIVLRRKQDWLMSERRFFRLVLRALRRAEIRTFINATYYWLDRCRRPGQSPSLSDYLLEEEEGLFRELYMDPGRNNGTLKPELRKKIRPVLYRVRQQLISRVTNDKKPPFK